MQALLAKGTLNPSGFEKKIFVIKKGVPMKRFLILPLTFLMLTSTLIGCTEVQENTENTPTTDEQAKEEETPTKASYTIEHYKQNIDDDEYTLVIADTENKTGKIENYTSAIAKDYDGFTSQKPEQQKIAADGSTTVKIYYDRKKITLTLNLYGGKGDKSITGKYGEAVINATVPTKTDSLFNGWEPALPATFPLVPTLHTAVWVKGSDTVTADGCTYTKDMKTLLTAQKDITTATIPDGVTKIGENAFKDCTELTNITIPNSVTEIGFFTFSGCENLEYNEYGNALYIGNVDNPYLILVKAKDTSITSCEINNDTKIILYAAFDGCKNVETLAISDGITSFDNLPITPALKEVTIGKGITSICDYAFFNCKNLTNVTLPDNVTYIGESAFSCCDNLVNISIPEGVTEIGDYAFYGCASLPDITLPDNVTELGNYTFYGCNSLASITIPDGVTEIGNHVFYGCDKLANITIPDNVTEIGTHAFYSCTSLANITLPDNVTEIGSHAFYSCDSLASITIPNNVTEINDYTFSCCDNLINISIPDNVTKIGEDAFDGCTSLTDMTIPDSVTEIGRYAFSDCASLASVTIPNSITFIGYYAFSNCSSLENVYIFDLEAWCNIEFSGNPLSNGANLYLNGNLVKDLVIPDSVAEIRGAFSGCSSLESVTIPDGVTEIGNSAFYGCTNLTSITIPDSVTEIYAYAFSGCSSLTSITIPDSVTNIYAYAFSGCSNLTSITIPDGVTIIGFKAFEKCSRLTSVIIPDKVTEIGFRAFNECSNLTSVTFKDTVGWKYGWEEIEIDVTDPAQNAVYLKETYLGNSWYKK